MPTERELQELNDSAFASLKKAVEELVTVKVVTFVGNEAFAKATGQPAGTEGAATEVNMATGDITAAYSNAAAAGADVRSLHDAAVARGAEIFTRNIDTLKNLVLALTDRLRA
ncbi:MAG: hypothetical protein IT556_14250 [Acetobacteraceae bacterium]|nr:hypothetical protein [Acetobacteraceae bacterium]